MDMEIQMPTRYELNQLCVPALSSYVENPTSFSGHYKNSSSLSKESTAASLAAREQAIMIESQIIGARSGAMTRYRSLQALVELNTIRSSLDFVFDFKTVMQDARITPPVISEVKGSVELSSDRQAARTTQRSWRILEPAKLTTTALNWRVYLNLDPFTKASHTAISAYFKPRSKLDHQTWQNGFCDGFAIGHKQANRQFTLKLTKLRRDFLGMWRFRQLELQGVVSAHVVSETRLGIRVSDEVVLIDERDIRISETTHFNAPSKWQNVQLYRELSKE